MPINRLGSVGHPLQIIVWDAFIFTVVPEGFHFDPLHGHWLAQAVLSNEIPMRPAFITRHNGVASFAVGDGLGIQRHIARIASVACFSPFLD